MDFVKAVGFGIFILIMIYLGVKNAGGVTAIFNSGGSVINTGIKTLQGR